MLPNRYRRISIITALAPFAMAIGVARAQPSFAEVQNIFEERCTICHSGEAAPVGLQLTTHEDVLRGSQRGPVVIPGDPEASELVRRVKGISLPRMPLTGPPFLDDAQIDLIVSWIAAGAPPPAEDTTEEPPLQRRDADAGATGTFASVEGILLSRCVECHSDDGVMGAPPEGLRLGSYEDVLRGSERVVVVPGAPLASELFRRVTGHSLPRMPLDGPPYLSDEQISAIRDWIAAGAPDTEGRTADLPVGAHVRLQGTLTARWKLDGLPLHITGSTRIDDAPGVGDYVEVRGTVGTEGEIQAERIRRR